MDEVRQYLLQNQQHAEPERFEQQRYTRDVENRAFREIDRARAESKAARAQFKEINDRLQAYSRRCSPASMTWSTPANRMPPPKLKSTPSATNWNKIARWALTRLSSVPICSSLFCTPSGVTSFRELSAAVQARAETFREQLTSTDRCGAPAAPK